jgi:hypothetical protein
VEQLNLHDALGTIRIRIEARPTIAALRAEGLGPTAIARTLNTQGISTPSGRGRWYPETVLRHVDPGPWNAYMREYRRRRSDS